MTSKEKSEIIDYLKKECHDFLNCEGSNPFFKVGDVEVQGFYIEIDDIADIIIKRDQE